MMCDLSQHFDFLIESCQVGLMKPEPQIYKFVLETLKAQPSEVSRHSLFRGKGGVTEILQQGTDGADRLGCTLRPGSLVLGPFLLCQEGCF